VPVNRQPGRPEGRSPAGASLCRPKECCPVEIVNVCGSQAWQALGALPKGDCAGLCRSEGRCLVENLNVCGSPAWQVLGAQPCRAEIV
jgi:hypothetical protein